MLIFVRSLFIRLRISHFLSNRQVRVVYVIFYILNEALYISMNAIVRFSLVGIFTVRNSSCGKVMFLHLSVILFTGGSMCGRWACVAGVCVCGGVCAWGHAWQGICVAGGCAYGGSMCAWQERWPLQRTVRILLECILVTCCNLS